MISEVAKKDQQIADMRQQIYDLHTEIGRLRGLLRDNDCEAMNWQEVGGAAVHTVAGCFEISMNLENIINYLRDNGYDVTKKEDE